jgi:hypothetical protein
MHLNSGAIEGIRVKQGIKENQRNKSDSKNTSSLLGNTEIFV